jgi:hypothetical protein
MPVFNSRSGDEAMKKRSNIVRDAIVSAIEMAKKITIWSGSPTIPVRASRAATIAPTPNHNSTNPLVKSSAAMKIAPRVSQIIQRLDIARSSAKQPSA